MEKIIITPFQLILFWTVAGFLLGLVLLILGIVRKKTKFGVIGLISSTGGGALGGIFLIVPILAVFIWLIFKKPEAEAAAASPETSDSGISDAEVSDLVNSDSEIP